MQKRGVLLIVGAGGHGRAVAEAAELSGTWADVVFADDGFPGVRQSGSWQVVAHASALAELAGRCDAAIVAIGNQGVRERLSTVLEAQGIPLATVVHPRAWVSGHAIVGEGTAVMAGAVVGACARIGRGAIVNANATVDHDAELGDFAHLGVGVQLAGGVRIGARAWLQAGTCAGYRVQVAEEAVVPPGERLIAS